MFDLFFNDRIGYRDVYIKYILELKYVYFKEQYKGLGVLFEDMIIFK